MKDSACRQWVTRPYPRWGESRFVAVPHRREPLHLLWQEAERPRGGLLLVHGMNEYSGRYRHVAAHFAAAWHLVGVDLHAHGLTNPVLRAADEVVRRGTARVDASAAFLAQADLRTLAPMREDFRSALAFLRRRCDGPLFVLAHSLGGLIAAQALLEEPHGVAGLVLFGPAFAVSRLPGWRGRLANPLIDVSFRAYEGCLIRRYVPACLATLPMEAVMELASLPGLRRLLTPCRPSWVLDCLTDWEAEKTRLREDGYIVTRTLLRWVVAIEKAIVCFRAHMAALRVPYFLVYAREDPITAAWGNEDFWHATRHNHPANRMLALPVPYHEQLFMKPPVPQRLLTEVTVWLAERAG
ncbi:hypothetical protein MIN45_P0807 [Methylomarinovum tepidoasis]|uniref:Serine aminopeptidase S33 domain-containing protein n=1 Tax=Methylomarinovum tepidoasis TaxID=2840183 RepID=A0AAU9BY58_9GAMM|nr:alpha/beta fold hydrolase [Methylomarinovum sp. IN45]BCX88438.1 hypothetical protein MIN45_P0807 [Methylomarinovum sp. IN45]